MRVRLSRKYMASHEYDVSTLLGRGVLASWSGTGRSFPSMALVGRYVGVVWVPVCVGSSSKKIGSAGVKTKKRKVSCQVGR